VEEDVTAVCECCSCHVYLSRNNVCPAICTVYFMTVVHTVDIDYIASVDGMADIDYIRTGRCQCHALQGL